jgi:hypothetical protein
MSKSKEIEGESRQASRAPWLSASLLAVLVVIVWVLGGLFASERESPGAFGDMFGAVNALFSGLAFAGVVYAILLQRNELELQRQELSDTRTELHAQTEHFARQNATLAAQSTDNTFFQLLSLHND